MTQPPHRQPPAGGGAPKAPVTPPQLQAPVDPNAAAATAHANAASAHANAATPAGPPTAGPQLSEGDQSTMNDDWTKVTTWDVTDASGAPVSTLDALADVLDTDRTSAASMLLASPMAASAPPELLAEADAEVNPDGSGGLAGEFSDVSDTDTSADTGGDGSDPTAGPAAAAEDAADGGADDDVEDPQGNPIAGKSIRAGAMVSWHGGMGRVELVASNGGTIPGVPGQVVGTKNDPACRVRVYEQAGGQWKPSGQRIAVKAAHLSPAPATRRVQTKDATAQLVLLTAQHAGPVGSGKPTAEAIKAVFDRGRQSWPGEVKTLLSAQDWALGRVRAFVAKAEGGDVEHYVGDDDLLP